MRARKNSWRRHGRDGRTDGRSDRRDDELRQAVEPTPTGATTVHVIEHAITDTENPTVGGTDAKGNILTFNNPVFDPSDTKQVGHDEGFCTRISPKQGIWECLWTTFLKGGQITVQGPFYDTRNSVLSITGGTGTYPKRSRSDGPALAQRRQGVRLHLRAHVIYGRPRSHERQCSWLRYR